jgi:hypothetical protein
VNCGFLSGTTRIVLSVEAGTDVSTPIPYKRDPVTDEICARSLRQTTTLPHHFITYSQYNNLLVLWKCYPPYISRPEKRNIRYALSTVAQSHRVYRRLCYVVGMETRYFSIKIQMAAQLSKLLPSEGQNCNLTI